MINFYENLEYMNQKRTTFNHITIKLINFYEKFADLLRLREEFIKKIGKIKFINKFLPKSSSRLIQQF